MINLLPPKAKKILAVEYRLRLLSVVLLVLGIACLIALVLSIPSFILLDRQAQSLVDDNELAREISEESVRIREELNLSRSLIAHLSKPVKLKPYSDVMSQLDALAGSGVSIDQFAFDARDTLVITGTASSRTDLSVFRDRLEERSDFRSVDLPLASLVKDVDLPFSITITFK